MEAVIKTRATKNLNYVPFFDWFTWQKYCSHLISVKLEQTSARQLGLATTGQIQCGGSLRGVRVILVPKNVVATEGSHGNTSSQYRSC